MKAVSLNIFTSILVVLFLSCAEEEIKVEDPLIIEFGSNCGWCAGNESITISENKIEYNLIIPCGENQGTVTKTQNLEQEKWIEIKNAVDFALFSSLIYNECNVCVDGCDEIITITQQDETHKISYDPGMNIKEIQSLQDKLREILSNFREPAP